MSAGEEQLTALRRHVRDWAGELRPYALAADRDPGTVLTLPPLTVFTRSAFLQIPARMGAEPFRAGGRDWYLTGAVERSVFCEEVAAADFGLMLALPGASMAGVLVATAGSRAQQEWFFGRLLERPTWTFFALTEPEGGSDAGALRTRLERRDDGSSIACGAKRYVSNAVRAGLGVVFLRTGPGPLGVGAILVDTAEPGFHAEPLETIGVRAAQLGAVTLDRLPVPPERVLGQHLSPVRRGAWGWLRTFNLLRPTVAAMGVGLARAAHEYVGAQGPPRGETRVWWERTATRIARVRHLTLAAAAAADRDPDDGHLGSAAKLAAAELADRVTREAAGVLGPAARAEHPLLDKFCRDARALEFMEGAGAVQRLAVFGALARGRGAGSRR